MKNRLILLLSIFLSLQAAANNMLVQNVTTTGNNAAAKTIQVQFDLSWDNSWRDALNWDAAWIFIKFKDVNGLWQHAQLNPTGFANGSGTANTAKLTSDKVGCWVYRSALGSGTFNSTGMQLQWNYGLSGLNDVTGLEVRVFSTEMVYVPEGEFNCAGAGSRSFSVYSSQFYRRDLTFNAPGSTFPVVNNRLSPVLTYNDWNPDGTTLLRIKGDAGLDTNSNGMVDNTTYPIGYKAFYCYKYEMTEQQYADFLNTLTSVQITTLGVAGTGISLSNGEYFSATPNRACVYADANRILAFADWSGIRPISFTEFNKASYGPLQPVNSCGNGLGCPNYPAWGAFGDGGGLNDIKDVGSYGSSTSGRTQSKASYFGILDMTGNAREPVVRLPYYSFTSQNGNGKLNASGNHDLASWSASSMLIFIDQGEFGGSANSYGFRYCRSAE